MSTYLLMIDAPTMNQSTIHVPLIHEQKWSQSFWYLIIRKRFKQIDYKKMSIPKIKALGQLDCLANGGPPRAIFIA
jgi:hypothetical protein